MLWDNAGKRVLFFNLSGAFTGNVSLPASAPDVSTLNLGFTHSDRLRDIGRVWLQDCATGSALG
jgi:hypothetical protein